MNLSKNPLDLLFQDIQKEIRHQRKHPRLNVKPEPVQSTYANPENWTLGRVVRLIHVTEGEIGDFQEYFHRIGNCRRLLPAVPGLIPFREELVFGDYWLHPKFSAAVIIPDSDQEIAQIEARFFELMEESDS